ncbi:MAG: hypothetical protein WB764_19300 [Xanthobacteraceae bacterium]
MTDMGGQIRIQVRIQVRATADPAAVNMRAAHTHGAPTAHTHAAATATEVSTAASTTEVTAAATATAEMSTTTAAAPETAAASGISNGRQTKGKAYCGRACCDFPHDTTSSSGPNAESKRRVARSVPAEPKLAMLQCTRHRSARHAPVDMWVI